MAVGEVLGKQKPPVAALVLPVITALQGVIVLRRLRAVLVIIVQQVHALLLLVLQGLMVPLLI